MSDIQSELLKLSPSDIIKNKDNPRLIFDPEDQDLLRESIKQEGILVPLTVYKRSSDEKYVLLDGERRWRCAQDLNLQVLPCNVIHEPTRVENILRMFSIHNTRKDWELVPTALKLETLIRILNEKSNTRLARLTGMSTPRIEQCRKILTFPKKYLDLAILGNENRISGDFFPLLYDFLEEIEKMPEIPNEFSRNQITEIMIEKYRTRHLRGVLDLRTLKRAYADSRHLDVSLSSQVRATRQYLRSQDMTTSEFYDHATGVAYQLHTIIKTADRLKKSLLKIDPQILNESKKLRRILKELRDRIDQVLK
jgi:ParB family chromosome partitioning protein